MTDTTPPTTSKPTSTRRDALAVVRRLRESGHVAYFAGGCVRDALLGLEPTDYDVATDATPDRVRSLFPRTQAVGQAFGVILVRQGRSQIEVATFRTDLAYADGRRPEGVVFTTAEEDAKRRDFTINGMFFDPVEDKVIDYVGGQADVRARVLRAVGNPDERFGEDHLRMLRAVRFAARFDLTIEPLTADAIRNHAPSLKRISPERVADELRRMLTASTRPHAWRALWDFNLIHEVMRFLNGKRPGGFRADRSIVTTLAPGRPASFGTVLAAAALCYRWQAEPEGSYPSDLLDPSFIAHAAKAMRQGLRISNEELDDMTGTLKDLATLLPGPVPSVAKLKRFLARPTARPTRQLMDAMESIPGYDWRRVAALRVELDGLAKLDYAPPPFITGDDLTAAGLTPGRAFKRALDEAYDAQLEGRVTTREQAMELGVRIARGDA